MEILTRRLKEARLSKKYTQEDLGKLIKVQKSTICHFEKGDRTPSIEMLVLLADELQVSIDYLTGRDYFTISEEKEQYGMKISKEELNFIKQIRNERKLYSELQENPKNLIDRMKLKL